MMHPVIIGMHYEEGRLSLVVQGHLTDATNFAYELARQVFGFQRWRITHASYKPPSDSDYASSGTLTMRAKVVK